MRFPLMSQKYESVFKCDHSGCPRAETPAVLHDSRHTWPSTHIAYCIDGSSLLTVALCS